jgi:hypothetical protein
LKTQNDKDNSLLLVIQEGFEHAPATANEKERREERDSFNEGKGVVHNIPQVLSLPSYANVVKAHALEEYSNSLKDEKEGHHVVHMVDSRKRIIAAAATACFFAPSQRFDPKD